MVWGGLAATDFFDLFLTADGDQGQGEDQQVFHDRLDDSRRRDEIYSPVRPGCSARGIRPACVVKLCR